LSIRRDTPDWRFSSQPQIDDVKTQKVTAQLIVYNAELGYFGNVMVFFEFSEGTCWGFPNHGLPVSPHDTDAFLLLLQKKAARFE
jgi:hypothetical protein